MPVTVTMREGRDGRDASEVGGPIIMILQRLRPIDVGEVLELPDGSFGRVVQAVEHSSPAGVSQSVTIVDA